MSTNNLRRPAFGIILVLGAVTLALVAVPELRPTIRSLPLRVVLEVSVIGSMACGAALLALMRRQPGGVIHGRDAFIAALVVQALANFIFGVVPAVFGDGATFTQTFYPWLVGRYVAGVLFLGAAIQFRPRRNRSTVGIAALLIVLVELVVLSLERRLPLPPIVPPGGMAATGWHTLFESIPLVLFGWGSIVAGKTAQLTREPLDRWLSLALLVGVFTQIHQALFPAALGQFITSADVLRATSALLLLVGVVGQVLRLQDQRNRALTLLQEDLARNQRLLASLGVAREREAVFASVVGHELASPLASINAHVHVLGAIASNELAPHIEAVRGEAARLGTLIRRMEELKDLEQDDFQVDRRPVAIVPLLQEVAAFTKGLASGHTVLVDATSARVDADPVRLGQVLRNVTANAIRFAPAGTTVTITGCGAPGDHYLIRVSDEGPGVHTDDVDRLFTPYARGRAGEDVAGTGLGLHIARQIVAAHEGSISFIDPEQPGARVQVVLQVAT